MLDQEIQRVDLDYSCAVCGSELVKLWISDDVGHAWVCGKDHTHKGWQKKLSTARLIKRGELDKVHGSGAQKDFEERARRSETSLSLLPKADVATKAALGIAKIGELVLWAESLGLNAHLGHVCLYFGEPYVTIDGYYYLNNKRDRPFSVGTRPMTAKEKIAYMIEDAAYAYLAEVWLDGVKLADTGCGYVTKDEVDEKSKKDPSQFRSPIAHAHPQRMAEKRAEWQLLRKLIPLEVKE